MISSSKPETSLHVSRTDREIQRDYDAFVNALTQLSRRYGIAIQSVGGVYIADNAEDFAQLRYRADLSSGDLLPEFD